MTSKQDTGVSADRIQNSTVVKFKLLECCICKEILWKPVACTLCETPFCLKCIRKWLSNNPDNCPKRCKTYSERKCPAAFNELLAEIQVSCYYNSNGCENVIPYEALDKHEIECGFQESSCPGCEAKMLLKDLNNHTSTCGSIQFTCNDCKLVYTRTNAEQEHTEIMCLKRQMRDLKILLTMKDEETIITFDDVSNGTEQRGMISDIYKAIRWTDMNYRHKNHIMETRPDSGFATSFTPGGSQYIVFFNDHASIRAAAQNKRLSIVWIKACAAWSKDVVLTIEGYKHGVNTEVYKTTLLLGQPKQINLSWEEIDEVKFVSEDRNKDSESQNTSHVVITQIKMTVDN